MSLLLGECLVFCRSFIFKESIMFPIENNLIVVSLEQEAKVKGRRGLNVMAYTSELWSLIVAICLPDRMSHSLIVESQEPESKQ